MLAPSSPRCPIGGNFTACASAAASAAVLTSGIIRPVAPSDRAQPVSGGICCDQLPKVVLGRRIETVDAKPNLRMDQMISPFRVLTRLLLLLGFLCVSARANIILQEKVERLPVPHQGPF